MSSGPGASPSKRINTTCSSRASSTSRSPRLKSCAARFAVPAGTLLGTGMIAGYLFALHNLDLSVPDARTVALTSLIVGGIYLILALEAGGSRTRSTLVTAMCACMLGLYVAAFLVTPVRHFFALTVPSVVMVLTALLASAVSIVDTGAVPVT